MLFSAKFRWYWPMFLEMEMKMWKVYDNNDNDDGQIVTRKATEPSDQVSYKYIIF